MGFRFEEQVEVSEEAYVLLHGFATPVRPWKQVVWVAAIVALFTFAPSAWFGVGALGLFALGHLLNWLPPRAARQRYRELQHLHAAVTSGVSDEALWLHGNGVELRFSWAHVSGWRRLKGWLWFGSGSGAVVYLREDSLRSVGLYEEVVSRASAVVSEGQSRVGRGGL